MKVLVIGGGGREHALVWALLRSPRVSEVVAAPGNAGISMVARCIPVSGSDVGAMVAIAEAERPGLVVVGPELPLALGLVDRLQELGMRVFGPTQGGARLETSKAFAKEFMRENGIDTAAYAVCRSVEEVRRELGRFQVPVVVKADGLAAGKGVVICATETEAIEAAEGIFSGELLGAEEGTVVLEEFLEGEELSFFALCDGTTAVPIAAAQDHKRVGEGDTGPNTGGMGAYSTDELLSPELRAWLTEHVAQKTVDGMRRRGEPFRGVLFCGMMMTSRGPMVLEFNTRFGDPETEALMLRLETDVLDVLEASVDGTADRLQLKLRKGASACVILASGGYPGKYATGKPISGELSVPDDVVVFHCGTSIRGGERDGALVTAGGRVLGVSAASELGLQDALRKVYAAIGGIEFEGMQFRRDIGWRALGR